MKKIFFIIIITILISYSFYLLNLYQYAAAEKNTSSTNLKDDETLMFFPSYAYRDAKSSNWKIDVHAWVFEPEENSVKRGILIKLLKNYINLKDDDINTALFMERAHFLFVDQESNRKVSMQLGGLNFYIGKTNQNGHAQKKIIVDEKFLKKVSNNSFIFFSTYTEKKPVRTFTGQCQVIADEGISIVSDIDDTIKISEVLNRSELMKNTFLRPYREVPGMANLYKKWSQKGFAFHYISASPWQLFKPLSDFMKDAGFPDGSFHMKYFGLSKNFSNMFTGSDIIKTPYIKRLLQRFPKRKFILIGDSGEKDPEIYSRIAEKWPNQILAVFIRNVTNENLNNERFKKALKNTSKVRWLLFKDAEDLQLQLSSEI